MKPLCLLLVLRPFAALAQQPPAGKLAPQPLFRDPIHDGAADPVVIGNQREQKWWMLYTNHRATDTTATGVTWVHGTRIGIAESGDGGPTWRYHDTANISDRPTPHYTHRVPDVVEHQGLYHLFLTYDPRQVAGPGRVQLPGFRSCASWPPRSRSIRSAAWTST